MASATHSKTELFDHFLGAALDGRFAGVAENSGSAAISAGIEGGVVALTTGASDGNRAHIWAGRNWKTASGGIFFEARVQSVTSIATRALFIGLTDLGTQETPIELGASDAVTSNASDAVGFIYDTAADTDKWFIAGVKGNTDTALTAVNVGGVQVAPVADTWATFGIELSPAGHASFYYNGLFVGRIENCVTSTVLLTPIVNIETRTGGASTAYVDYISICGATA